jgi:hypothetical protein
MLRGGDGVRVEDGIIRLERAAADVDIYLEVRRFNFLLSHA